QRPEMLGHIEDLLSLLRERKLTLLGLSGELCRSEWNFVGNFVPPTSTWRIGIPLSLLLLWPTGSHWPCIRIFLSPSIGLQMLSIFSRNILNSSSYPILPT